MKLSSAIRLVLSPVVYAEPPIRPLLAAGAEHVLCLYLPAVRGPLQVAGEPLA